MYDIIVLGLGAMGSATAYHAARRGYSVLGLDTHVRNHTQGSSHGRSRIIRESYFEGTEYVPLVQRAYERWRELEEESGKHLITMTGGMYIGSPRSSMITGVKRSADEHRLACDYLSAAEVMFRFPIFHVPDGMVGVYEVNGGILDAEACVTAHLDLATRYGAELHHGEPVVHWVADGSGVCVETPQGNYKGERLIVAAGPWTNDVLFELSLPLTVWRVVNAHFEPTRTDFGVGQCPFYILDVPEGIYYGLPALADQGIKAGRHDVGEACTPRTIRRDVTSSEVDMLRSVLDHYVPGAAGALKATTTCIYTMTPDTHFLIDRHPTHSQVVYASCCSGHGFKFSSAIGEILTELAVGATPELSIGVFSASRFNSRPLEHE